MTGLEHWNDAVRLAEDRLVTDGPEGADELDVATLARAALTSEHHFRRMFSALAGMPLGEYVRRRRLTLATAEVVAGRPVLDVAVRHGYTSADAFTRAFRAFHGLTPQQARRPGAVLRSQPRLAFHLRIEGATTVRHRIEHTDPFRLVGRHARLPLVFTGENTALTAFEAGLPADLDARLAALADVPGLAGVLAASSGFEEGRTDGSSFDYHRAAATTRPVADLPADLDVLEVPAHQWVVLEAVGDLPDGLGPALQGLWASAYGEWFPANPYRTVLGPELLRVTISEDRRTGRGELWLPVEPA
ncbi:AraC family transcriptional regulator [Nocardioides litoris]|uniref:AraC family transcriptional regulator n=1 Tax=Nocardioides litoris TaxID=1926648 RepID=UPI00111D398C|nr:helix-turn-helix domain-containing protein [Nocardioides litoris]